MLMRRNQSIGNTECAEFERRFPIMGSMIGLLMLVNIGSTVTTLIAG